MHHDPPRRRHFCTCGWTGRRYAHAPEKPCPLCGGRVYLTPRKSSEKEQTDTVRVDVYLPGPVVEFLHERGAVSPQVRRIVVDHVAALKSTG